MHEAIRLTQELVQIPSENPTGTEAAMAARVSEWLKAAGAEVEVVDVLPGRPNVVARLRGRGEAPPFMLLAHLDTVPAGEGWSDPPFAGRIADGKMYGRGACDMKAGLAAAMVAMKRIIAEGKDRQGDLIVAAPMDEEGPGMQGATALARSGLIPRDARIIATEPSDLCLCPVHKGVVWYEVFTHGRMSHAGNAHLGADAAHGMALAIAAIKENVAALAYEHPLLGRSSISVGRIEGGRKTNVVTDLCRAELDFRLVPPLTCEDANRMLREVIPAATARVAGVRAEVRNLGHQRPPLEAPADSTVLSAIRAGYRRVTGREIGVKGFTAYTDAAIIGVLTGNPHVAVFGPGALEQAHTVDEWVEVDQIPLAADVLAEAIRVALPTA